MRCRLIVWLHFMVAVTSIVAAPGVPHALTEPILEKGDWKPVRARSELPAARPAIDQHASRVRIENTSGTLARQSRSENSTDSSGQEINRQNKAANPAIRESIKVVTNQLLDPSNITLDTRTPPKIKIHSKNNHDNKIKPLTVIENSHPGIAVPVEDEDIKILEEKGNRIVIHKNNNKIPTTTDSSLSTWVLLSGQSTTKIIDNKINKTTVYEKVRPNNKLRQSPTTKKPGSTFSTAKIPPTTTEKSPVVANKLINKIKASVLANSIKNKTVSNHTISTTTTPKPTTLKITVTTDNIIIETINSTSNITNTNSTVQNKNGTEIVNEGIDSSMLPLEPKDSGIDLNEQKLSVTKRPKRPNNSTINTQKRKKNKNRRRKPENKTNTKTNGTKVAVKEKPISTQIYNYLSREVMPSVGVGLVGLMVTAGLASYFLYPYGGILRRAYDDAMDRRDDKYYYNDDYISGGQSEEDLINKVIAGMPASSSGISTQDYLYNPNYKKAKDPLSFNTDPNYRDNSVRYRYSGSSYQSYPAAYQSAANYRAEEMKYGNDNLYYRHENRGSYNQEPNYGYDTAASYNDYSTPSYKPDVVAEHQKETGYTVAESDGTEMNQQKFVVGNVPKEMMLKAAIVPEHGPRNLKIRRKRNTDESKKHSKSIEDNEIGNDESNDVMGSMVEKIEVSTMKSMDATFKFEDYTKMNLEQTTVINEMLSLDTNQSTTLTEDSSLNKTSNEVNHASNNEDFSPPKQEPVSFLSFLRNLFEFKLRFGLSLMQHTTEAVSRYVRGVHDRMEQVLRDINTREQQRRHRITTTEKPIKIH